MDLPNFLEVKTVRQMLFKQLRETTKTPLQTPDNPQQLWNYLVQHQVSNTLGALVAERDYPQDIKVFGDKRYIQFSVLINQDLQHVNMYAAVCSWLTYDHFRWHVREGLNDLNFCSQVPAALNYGLILRYPRPVLAIASYLLNHPCPELALLQSSHYQAAEESARLYMVENCYQDVRLR